MSDKIKNWMPPTTDGRLALENRDLYVAQSAQTRDGKVPALQEVNPMTRLAGQFASVFGGGK